MDQCKKKWKNLRRYYNKVLDKNFDYPKQLTSWEHFEAMSFLFDHLRGQRKTLKSGKPAVAVRKLLSNKNSDSCDTQSPTYQSGKLNKNTNKATKQIELTICHDSPLQDIGDKQVKKRVIDPQSNDNSPKKKKAIDNNQQDEATDVGSSSWFNPNPVVLIDSAPTNSSLTTESIDPLALSIHNFIKDLPQLVKLKLSSEIFQLIYTTVDQYQSSLQKDLHQSS